MEIISELSVGHEFNTRCDSDKQTSLRATATYGTTALVLKRAMWLNDRQPVEVFKSLNDWQSDISLKFKKSKET